MEILYEHVAGDAPCLPLSIIVWSLMGIFAIAVIVMSIKDRDSAYLLCLFLVAIGVLVGFRWTMDTRYNEVVATINENVSWKDINDKYELLKQEGQLYTFRVKEDSNEQSE